MFRLCSALLALCLVTCVLNAQSPQTSSSVKPRITFTGDQTNAYILSITPAGNGASEVGVGLPLYLEVSVDPVDNYNQPVKLECDQLPPETSCLFQQQTVPAGGSTQEMQLQTTAPHDCGVNAPYFYGDLTPLAPFKYAGPVLAGVFLFWLPCRRRLRVRGLLGMMLLCGTLAMGGCGHCTDLGTRPGTYTFLLHATAQDTQASALGDVVTAKITVTVDD